MFLRDERKSRVIAAEKESCEWLNVALEKFFPIYSPGIADSVESAIIASLEAAMPVPPPPLTHVAVQGVDLGVNPPSIERIKTWQLEGHQWQMDCTLKYHGDIRIVVAAGVGMKGVSVSMPVAIKDLELEGRLRIHMSMTASPPFYKTLTGKQRGRSGWRTLTGRRQWRSRRSRTLRLAFSRSRPAIWTRARSAPFCATRSSMPSAP